VAGFAAAITLHLADKEPNIPPFAIETVYYSIASSKVDWSLVILSNSSMQQMPRSLKTKAPASKVCSLVN